MIKFPSIHAYAVAEAGQIDPTTIAPTVRDAQVKWLTGSLSTIIPGGLADEVVDHYFSMVSPAHQAYVIRVNVQHKWTVVRSGPSEDAITLVDPDDTPLADVGYDEGSSTPTTEVRDLGRRIYSLALSDRRGFRDDQLGIEEPDTWAEIFDSIGQAARREL